jgi:hypothetical protein
MRSLATVVAALLLSAPHVHAIILYDNLGTPTGSSTITGPSADIGGGVFGTRMLADDIQLFGSGTVVLQLLSFAFQNDNAVAVTPRLRLRFFDSTGPGGGPGSLVTGGVIVSGVTLNPGVTVGSVNLSSLNLFVPNQFWLGVFFDNNGTTVTSTELDNLGLATYNPPSMGSSADTAWLSSGSGTFFGPNPAGVQFNFGGSPVANFGIAIDAMVPEPSTMLLLAGGLVVMLAGKRRLRGC